MRFVSLRLVFMCGILASMNNATTYRAITGTIVLLIIASGIFLFSRRAGEGSEPRPAALDLSGVTATSGPVQKDGYTVEMESVAPKRTKVPAAPSLDRAVPETPSLSAEARVVLLAHLSKTIAKLRANALSYGDWIELGAARQVLGDYEGAAQAWSYAAALSPSTGVAYANLGYLYAHYLTDYAKAEANYLKGIANDPRAVNTYRNIFELYVYSYKQGTSAAEDILKKGIAKLPDALDLKILLARYYRDGGRTAEARTAYDAAIASATAQHNPSLAAELTAEATSIH